MTEHIRVTAVLERYSGLQKIPEHILQRAAERGSLVHDICDAIIEDFGVPPLAPEHQGYIDSFNRWRVDKKFIAKPGRLYCDKHMITGEVDQIYQDKEGLVLVDFKTPAKESNTWCLQASAYYYLCAQNGYDISRIEFIQLPKDGSDAKIFVYKENFEMFLKCLDIHRFFPPSKDEEDYLQYM